jgi:hypothetical protein
MAASVVLYEYTGTSAGTTSSSDRFAGNIRFRANDEGSETNTTANPIVKGAGAVWSMERWLRMRALSGIVTSLTNPNFYTANTTWDSGNVVPYVRTAAAGATPATPVNHNSPWNPAHNYLTGARLGLGTYTVTTTPNFIGDFLVAMVEVAAAASSGSVGSETWTWAYDEA